jgi:hypothetical protein
MSSYIVCNMYIPLYLLHLNPLMPIIRVHDLTTVYLPLLPVPPIKWVSCFLRSQLSLTLTVYVEYLRYYGGWNRKGRMARAIVLKARQAGLACSLKHTVTARSRCYQQYYNPLARHSTAAIEAAASYCLHPKL